MEKFAKKRRPRGQGALGNVHETKLIATSIIEQELKHTLEKSQRLREARLAAEETRCKLEL
jgi:hypothetical protein